MGALRRAAPAPSVRPFSKSKLPRGGVTVAPAARGAVAQASPTRLAVGADQKLSAPGRNLKVVRNGIVVEMELDALHALLKNSRLVAPKPRSGAPVESSIKTPPEKRRKLSALAKIAEVESTEDADEFIDICGGVSPIAIQNASPVVSVEKAGETGNCASSSSDSGSSCSSDSDSDSDSDKTVDIPAAPAVHPNNNGASAKAPPEPASEAVHTSVKIPVPQTVLPKENGTSVQPSSEPATKVVQRAELEKPKDKKRAAPTAISKAALIAKAKVRRTLLEMETAVLPDESINPRDLKDLCIPEYGCPSTMRQLGLFLKADA